MKMKNPFVITLATLTISVLQARAAVTVYTDEASFINALSGAQSLLDFNTTALGPISGSEFSSSGFTFMSPLSGPPGQLEIASAATPFLSVGRQPGAPGDDGNNDSIEVGIVGDWRAVGFRFIDGLLPGGGESITFFGESDSIVYKRSPGDGATGFLGVVADAPIRRVSIIEATSDFDDVGYDNFRLAAVPEPNTGLLFASGLMAVLRFRRRRHDGA
jgi:hypothetical protein